MAAPKLHLPHSFSFQVFMPIDEALFPNFLISLHSTLQPLSSSLVSFAIALFLFQLFCTCSIKLLSSVK